MNRGTETPNPQRAEEKADQRKPVATPGEMWPMVVVADGIMLAFAPFAWQFAKAQVTTAVDPANLLVHWHYRAEAWQADRAGEIGRHPVDWADTRSAAKYTSCAKSTCFRRRPFD